MLRLLFACLFWTATAFTAWRPHPASVLRSPSARHAQRAIELRAQNGWVASVDQATGQTFYLNEQTGESQWEPPPQAQASPPVATQGGWVASVDPATGQTFYQNELTGESQWEPPPQAQASPSVATQGWAPPSVVTQSGWVAQVDQASGQTYYLNEQTGESSWEPPPQQPAGQQVREHNIYDPRSRTQSYDQYVRGG